LAPTLRELAQEATVPLSGILRDHHEGLCCLVSELEVVGHRTAELARQGIADLAARAEGGDLSGVRDRASHTMRVVLPDAPALLAEGSDVAALDCEGAYQEVIIRTARLRMPSLLAFLR
jgi:hypothetical protein